MTKLLRASLSPFTSREASADNIISTSSSFSPFPVPLHASSVLRLASTRGRPGLQARSWWGHARPCPCPGGALRRLDRLAYGRSPWPVDLPGFEQWQSWTLALDPHFEINFPFLSKNVRFVIFHPKLALPPPPVSKCVTFRKKLRTYEMLPNIMINPYINPLNPLSTGQSKIGRQRPIKFRLPLCNYFSTDLYK